MVLATRYNIIFRYIKNSEDYSKAKILKQQTCRILISGSSYDLLKILIFPYFIESMLYKFPEKSQI